MLAIEKIEDRQTGHVVVGKRIDGNLAGILGVELLL